MVTQNSIDINTKLDANSTNNNTDITPHSGTKYFFLYVAELTQ
jgi:hypothetical protein